MCTGAILDQAIRRSAFPLGGLVLAAGCRGPIPDRDPVGEHLPRIRGRDLDRNTVAPPEGIAGSPTIRLVGYLQDTRFDIDRWNPGLLQAG